MDSLSDFQHKLTTALVNQNASQEFFVAITLDEDRWLIDLKAIKEASVPPKLARIAGAPPWALGIGNFKGNVWSVIDMRYLLHDETTFNPRWGWVTLLNTVNEHEVALLWSEIVEISAKRAYKQMNDDGEIHPWSKGQWLDKDNQVWNEFDVLKLVGKDGLIASWIGSVKQ